MRSRALFTSALPFAVALVVGLLVGTYVLGPSVNGAAVGRARDTSVPSPRDSASVGVGPGASAGATASPRPSAPGSAGRTGKPGASATASAPSGARAVPPAKEGDVPILYYHRVEGLPAGFAGWTKTAQDNFLVDDTLPTALTAQLDWLQGHGYTTILPRDLAAHWDSGKPLPPRPIVLTFDDGFTNWVSFVMPQLRQRHMVAEFYVTLANLGRSFTWADVKALAKGGMGIGAHDVHHMQIAGAGIHTSAATERTEVTEAKRELEQQSGVTVDSMAYVGGGYDAGLMAIVRQAGYTTARSIDRGVMQSSSIRYRLHVSRISWHDDVTNINTGAMTPGLPMFAKRVSGANPG